MKHLTVLIALAFAQYAFASEYSWFEQNWETSFELIVTHNPEYQGVDEEMEQYLKSIHPMQWNVNGGLLTVVHNDGSTHTSPYSISPVDQLTFELIFTDLGEGTTLLIHRKKTGFCSQLKPTTLKLGKKAKLPRDYTGALEVKVGSNL